MWAGLGAGLSTITFLVAILVARSTGEGIGLAFLLPVITIVLAATSLTHLRSLFRLRFPLMIPARCPPPLNSLQEVSAALREGVLPVYDRAPALMARVRRILGGRLGWGTWASQLAAQRVLGSVGPVAMGVVALLVAGFVGFASGYTQGTLALLVAFGGSAILVLWAYRSYREVENLFPAEDPPTSNLERMGTVQGGGDPFVLRSEIEQRMMALRTQGLPNRVMAAGWMVPVETLQNAGRVTGDLLIETHPELVPSDVHPSAGRFGELSHLPTQVAALTPILFLPGLGVGVPLVGAVLFVAALLTGNASLGTSKRTANRFRWRSTLVYVSLEGSVGRSEIRAGRGHADSFESTNTVIRSDCQIRIHAAGLLSENLAIDGYRDLIALSPQGNAGQAMETVLSAIQSFESAGVRIRSIDLHDPGLEQTARANLAMEAERRRAIHSARADSLPSADLADASARLTNSSNAEELPVGVDAPPPALPSTLPADAGGKGVATESVGADGGAQARPIDASGLVASFGEAPVGTFGGLEVHEVPRRPVATASRSMRLRCPRCGVVNEFRNGEHVHCTHCGFTKYR